MKLIINNIATFHSKIERIVPFLISIVFFIAYSTLSIVRHNNFGSFGFDLGMINQIVWKFAYLKEPLNTIYQHPFTSTFTDHIEFIYIFIAPLYRLFPNPITLLIIQAFLVTSSGIAVFYFARFFKLHILVSYALMISYLMFYGIQNALWFEVHSLTLAAGILPWFLYFLYTSRIKLTVLFFILAISCKEDIALFTFMISLLHYWKYRAKISLVLAGISFLYLCSIFLVYFPYFTEDGYRFQSTSGLFSNLNPLYMIDTDEKRSVIFYATAWFGFLPLLSPVYLLPALADLAHYFILGRDVPTAQTFFMHYRVVLALLFVWPAIMAINKYRRRLNTIPIACYILLWAFILQYILHLPLSYLVKQWFWTTPSSVTSINAMITHIPHNASIVSQNNITPHISGRDVVFTLWPEKKDFGANSPCDNSTCDWFRWEGNPQYLIVDTAHEWDIRHFLTHPQEFKNGLTHLEDTQVISKEKQIGTTILYRVHQNPSLPLR